ncbi:unnamed protein product [Symbiodinium sp. KB8]|nr:unnamed protein product [Symbiodinium sp. KB8]
MHVCYAIGGRLLHVVEDLCIEVHLQHTAPLSILRLLLVSSFSIRPGPGESFPTRTRLAFDGLDDLEEEEEEPLTETGTVPKDRALIPRPVGSGFQSLEDLYDKHRGTKKIPELEEEELEELHVLLKDEIQRCPSISSVAWAAKALEELELEDDDVFEVIAEKVTDQVDELSPQETLDIVLSFGAIYYNDDEFLETLVGAVRRQMKFFTNAEVVRLANAMSRLGGLDDTKHVGMFFEMRKRVNMPLIDKAIRERLRAEATYPTPTEDMKQLISKVRLPQNSRVKKQFKSKMAKQLTLMKYTAEAEAAKQEEIDPELVNEGPDLQVLIMDLAEEGDLTKRLLGGVDAAGRKVESLFGGVFRLLQAAEKRPSGLTSWLWSSTFDVMEHAVRLKDHNPALPDNIFLISSGAWPRAEAPMSDDVRKEVCERIRDSLEKSTETWKLFCDTDGDRRPSPYTMLAYGLCDEAIVPLHLNKGDLDRTETMLGVMHELRQRGEIRTQVLFIVWNFVKVLKDDPVEYQGMTLPFTPTKVCMDILESCNRRLFGSATELAGLFVHSGESETDFIKNSTAVLRVLADNVLKPSEELGVPVVEMVSRLADSGKKTMKFQSGDIAYDTKGETISNVMDGLKQLEEKFEAMALG